MASKIRIFRSTGATAPSSLEYGELAVTVEQGTQGTSANKAGRLFVGNASGNPVELGGEYTYKLMDHVHGSLINSSVAIVDSNGQIDGWNVAGILTATRTNITDLVATNINLSGVSTFTGAANFSSTIDVDGQAIFDDITVSAASTFGGIVDINSDVTISGTLDVDGGAEFDDINVSSAATVGILTVTNDVNIGGALYIQGQQVLAEGGSTTFANLNVTGITTLGDAATDIVDINGRAGFATDVTLDGHLLVSGISTFTGVIDGNGGADISGGETTLSSATVSDLTEGRVVLAGTSGALEDSGNLTFGAPGLVVGAGGINVTGVSTFNNNVEFAGTIDVDGQAIFDDITVSAAATVTGALDVDSNATFAGTIDVDGQAIFDDITVSAAATFTGAIDANGGANISGGETVLSSATVSDLTDNRVVIAGASGALEDSSNLTFDGTTLAVTGNQTVSGTIDVDGQAIFDDITVSAASTFTGVVDINNNVTISGTLDVDAQAIFDDVTVSAAMTVTGAVDFNGGLDVSGGETTLSSATVSDLTDNRVVIAGASGALEDDGNLTYDGTDLSTNSLKVTDLTPTRVLFAGTGGAVEDDADLTFSDRTLTVTDLNVSSDARVGGALTVFGNLTVEGTETIINVERMDVQDKTVGVASTSTASNTTADGGGFFVHGGSDGDKQIFWKQDTNAFEPNVNWFPETDDALDLGNATHEWRNIFIDGLAELDDVNVSAAATIATVDINGGAIDGVTIGGASAGAGTFTNLTATDANITADARVGAALTVTGAVDFNGGLDVSGGETVLSSATVSDLTNNRVVIAGTSGALEDSANLTFNGTTLAVTGNQTISGTLDVDAQAIFDDVTVSAAATIATVDINGGAIDGTTIGAASSAAGTFTSLNYTTLTGGAIVATGSRIDAGDVTFTNLRVTGVSTVASLFLSAGTNTNGAAYFDTNGQLQSTATPSAGIQTSNFILTTNASGVPSWTDTIDCGQF